ncbi:hypothetical protein [Peptoniphilus sp.]|jgi:hypothetical protein|uniref:hypothetical protein n=1 Tax=Peptoniphilus sp. TaxID=1971214 RepID=UPI003D94A0C8
MTKREKIYIYLLTAFVMVAILFAEFRFSYTARDMRVYYYIFSLYIITWIAGFPRKFDKFVLAMYVLQIFLALNIIFKFI